MYFFIILFIIILLYVFLLFLIINPSTYFSTSNHISTNFITSNEKFFWPTPGFYKITSKFGKRNSPTSGASSNHSGIDISAPEGTNIYSVLSGQVAFTGFLGANGYSIIVNSTPYIILYCHVSPNYLVHKGLFIEKGQLISHVGPKYINNISNNPYTDSSGKQTNGATTGAHLHLTIKHNNIPIDPLSIF